MKQIKILLLLTMVIFSCSKEEPVVDKPVEKPVVLSTEKTEFFVGDEVAFTVKTNDKDVSENSELYVAGSKVAKNPHTFTKEGEYEVYAKHNGKKSNTIKVTIKKKAVAKTTTLSVKEGTEFFVGDNVTFITKEDNKDVSTNSELYVAGKKVTKNPHVFAKAGEYEVYTMYNNTKSNVVKVKVKEKEGGAGTTGVTISIEGGNNVTQGETKKFIVTYNGKVVKDSYAYTINVNKAEVVDPDAYKFKTAGKTEITVIYYTEENKEVKGEPLIIDVAPDGKKRSYIQNILVQKLTGTWCPQCATPSLDLKKTMEKYSQMIAVNVHGNSATSGTDPFAYSNIKVFADKATGLEYPTTYMMDFYTSVPGSYIEDAEVEIFTKNKSTAGLAIHYDLKNKKATVKVGFDEVPTNAKLVVYLVEDKLTGSQANEDNTKKGLSGYGKGDPILNFEYNNVLRASLTNEKGDAISSEIKNNEFSKVFTVDTKGTNAANTKIVAYIVDSNEKVINVQVAKANENKDFQK